MFRKKIGYCCGGFIAVDEGTACMAKLQWIRILVKSVRRVLPEELHLVIGSTSFSFQLWWEVSPCYSLVVQRSCSSELGVLENKDDGVRGSCTNSSVGKSLQHLLIGDGDVSCSYVKKLTGEATVVEKTI